MTKSIQTLSLTFLLSLAPLLCGSMLWVCLTEASPMSAVRSPQSTEVRTLEVYCHVCPDESIIRLLPKTWKIEKRAKLKLQWALETETTGKLTFFSVKNPNDCPAKVRVIFQSKLSTLEEAVSEWIKAEGGR